MKSAGISTYTRHVSDIRVSDLPVPEPGPRQVRVRMLKSPVNPSDLNFVHGTYHTALQRIVWNQGDADRTPVYYDADLKTAWRHLAGIHVGRCKARCCFTCCHFG